MNHQALARNRKTWRKPRTWAAILALSALIAGFAYALEKRNAWLKTIEQQEREDAITAKQVIDDVDDVCRALGRTPHDQAELELHLGRKLPNMHDEGILRPIHYLRTSERTYILQYELFATDDWIYNSSKPSAGWVQQHY